MDFLDEAEVAGRLKYLGTRRAILSSLLLSQDFEKIELINGERNNFRVACYLAKKKMS